MNKHQFPKSAQVFPVCVDNDEVDVCPMVDIPKPEWFKKWLEYAEAVMISEYKQYCEDESLDEYRRQHDNNHL